MTFLQAHMDELTLISKDQYWYYTPVPHLKVARQAPKKEAPDIPIAKARGFTARRDNHVRLSHMDRRYGHFEMFSLLLSNTCRLNDLYFYIASIYLKYATYTMVIGQLPLWAIHHQSNRHSLSEIRK